MQYVNHFLVLAAQSIIVFSPFLQIRHSLNYLVCHRAVIHINQESSCGTQLLAKFSIFVEVLREIIVLLDVMCSSF